jgi:hypothetical protein
MSSTRRPPLCADVPLPPRWRRPEEEIVGADLHTKKRWYAVSLKPTETAKRSRLGGRPGGQEEERVHISGYDKDKASETYYLLEKKRPGGEGEGKHWAEGDANHWTWSSFDRMWTSSMPPHPKDQQTYDPTAGKLVDKPYATLAFQKDPEYDAWLNRKEKTHVVPRDQEEQMKNQRKIWKEIADELKWHHRTQFQTHEGVDAKEPKLAQTVGDDIVNQAFGKCIEDTEKRAAAISQFSDYLTTAGGPDGVSLIKVWTSLGKCAAERLTDSLKLWYQGKTQETKKKLRAANTFQLKQTTREVEDRRSQWRVPGVYGNIGDKMLKGQQHKWSGNYGENLTWSGDYGFVCGHEEKSQWGNEKEDRRSRHSHY